MENHLQRVDDLIEHKFLPALFGHNITTLERELYTLPIKLGGLGISKLSEKCVMDYEASKLITAPLASIIVMQGSNPPCGNAVKDLKSKVKAKKEKYTSEKAKVIESKLSDKDLRSLEQLKEKGASSWLSAMPLAEHELTLNKSDFRDALAIRYRKKMKGLPEKCACGQNFDVNHAMNCKKKVVL